MAAGAFAVATRWRPLHGISILGPTRTCFIFLGLEIGWRNARRANCSDNSRLAKIAKSQSDSPLPHVLPEEDSCQPDPAAPGSAAPGLCRHLAGRNLLQEEH